MLAFEMTIEVAEEFWRRVIKEGANTEPERTAILVKMAKEGLMNRVSYTERSKSVYVKDLSKEFRVVEIKHEDR